MTQPLALQLEATVSRLTAELASSREAAEGLRRDLRAAQTDGEGRDRQHDASTRDLRKELRDCDETIGCVAAKRPASFQTPHASRGFRALRQQLRAAEAKTTFSSAPDMAHLAIIAELRAQLAAQGKELAGHARHAPASYVAPVAAERPLVPPPALAAAAQAPQQASPAPRAAPKPRVKKPQADVVAPAPKKVRCRGPLDASANTDYLLCAGQASCGTGARRGACGRRSL